MTLISTIPSRGGNAMLRQGFLWIVSALYALTALVIFLISQ
jgi:hypothetical protein